MLASLILAHPLIALLFTLVLLWFVVATAPAMATFGRRTVGGGSGQTIMVTADGKPEWKHGGITVDWSTVTALGADTVVDGRTILTGDKYLRYGTVVGKITANGKYGPIDTTAVDGRQTATRGSVYVLNETVVLSDPNSDHPPVFEGGRVYRDRLNIAGANQITEANFLAAFPRITLVRETA